MAFEIKRMSDDYSDLINLTDIRFYCSKGHAISIDDARDAKGKLPCGCPVTSPEGRRAEGLPPDQQVDSP